MSYVGGVYYWFSTLLREVFLRILRFSPLGGGQQFSQTAYGVCILRDDRDMISLSSVIIRVSVFLNRTVGIDMSKTVRFRATLTLTVTLLMLLGSDHLLWL